MRYTHTDHPRLPPRHLGEMRHHSTPLTIASPGTVLSISPMRVLEAWRVGAVRDREVRDGGYGRSRPRKERSWRRRASALRMLSYPTTRCQVIMLCSAPQYVASPHCAVLVWCYLHCVRSASPRLGVGGPCWMVSISERCDAPPGAGNTIPAAKPRSVVMPEVRSVVPTGPRCAMPEVVRSLVRSVVTGCVTRR